MANHKNAEKSIRKTERRTAINTRRKSVAKTAVKKIEVGLGMRTQHGAQTKHTPEELAALLRQAESSLMRAAQQGVVSKKAASRKVSRLTQRLRKLSV